MKEKCPSCEGRGQFTGIGASSTCKRCLGEGYIDPDDFIEAMKKINAKILKEARK